MAPSEFVCFENAVGDSAQVLEVLGCRNMNYFQVVRLGLIDLGEIKIKIKIRF